MRFKRTLLYLVIFMLLGEVFVRIDEKFMPFSTQIAIATRVAPSREMEMVMNNKLPIDDSTLRIMVLGDSYIAGAGINPDKKFSNIYRKEVMPLSGRYNKCLVLDVSRPSNNNLDNFDTYVRYHEVFKPNLVILNYNFNDIEDDLDGGNKKNTNGGLMPKHVDKPSFIKSVYNVIYELHIIKFVLHESHDYLKTFGIIVPYSQFDNELKSYALNKPNWIKSKVILSNLIDSTQRKKEKLMVVQLPEFNLLDHPQIFTNADASIKDFFKGYPEVMYIDPKTYFEGYHSKDLEISKYDGHPNEKAHQLLADSLALLTRNLYR